MLFDIGDAVLYSSRGVCTIRDITVQPVTGTECYVLEPVFGNGMTLYVPVDAPQINEKMRKVITEEEFDEMIFRIANDEKEWIANDRERQVFFKEVIASGDRYRIVQMLDTVYCYRQSIKNTGRKLHIIDEKMMKEAEALVTDEFAYILKIRKEKVAEVLYAAICTAKERK